MSGMSHGKTDCTRHIGRLHELRAKLLIDLLFHIYIDFLSEGWLEIVHKIQYIRARFAEFLFAVLFIYICYR